MQPEQHEQHEQPVPPEHLVEPAPPPDAVPGPDPQPLAAMRVRYVPGALREQDVAADPFAQFGRWLADAVAAGVAEPNAMVLGTVGPDGRPSSRTVLLKELDATGFVFYTNTTSRKAGELAARPAASLCFPWHAMARQVVVEGTAEAVDRATAQAYWSTRPRESQLGAWASDQSRPVADREALHARLVQVQERFTDVPSVPLPPHWGGFRVVPHRLELWQGQPGRLHDRLRYERGAAGAWTLTRLQP
jgi:pyridoxamine 5'-phosphate oxidase